MTELHFVPEQSLKDDIIGSVIGYDLSQDSIKILINPAWKQKVKLSDPIVVEDEKAKTLYYSIITNIYQQVTPTSINFAKYGSTIEGIQDEKAFQNRGFELYAVLSCLKQIHIYNKNQITRLPFSESLPPIIFARQPTSEELRLIYANTSMERYWIGSLVNHPEIMIPFDMNRMIESQTGIFGRTNSGKAQPLDAKILTPAGWITMGNLKMGDDIFGSDGLPHKIIGIFPQGMKEIFQICFNDGSSTECCADHLWAVRTKGDKQQKKPFVIKSTKELLSNGIFNNQGERKWYIPMTQSIQFPEQNLPIDPYVLGVLLGNGCLTLPQIRVTSANKDIIDQLTILLPSPCRLRHLENYDYSIQMPQQKGISHQYGSNQVLQTIRDFDLRVYSEKKFIPNIYKFASVQQRISILQGLLDTDGSPDSRYKHSGIEYSSSSEQLADDVIFLVQSLGGKATKSSRIPHFTYKGERKEGLRNYRIRINIGKDISLFRNQDKLKRYCPPSKHLPTRAIDSITAIGIKECQCILIDSDDHLYITDDCIVTHNTVSTRNLCKTLIHDPEYQLNTSMLIFDVMNEYAVGTVSSEAGNRGLLQYPQLRDKIVVFGLDDKHAELNHVKNVAGYDYRSFYIFKDNISALDILNLLEKEDGFSDLMRITIYSLESESYRRKRSNNPRSSFYEVLTEFYENGYDEDTNTLGFQFARNEQSYMGLSYRLRQFLDENSFLTRFLRDRPEGNKSAKDAFETMKYYLDHEHPVDIIEDENGINREISKSFVIYFGSFGSNAYVYDFIANVLGRKLYDLYSKNEQYLLPDGTRKYRNLIILLEEAHKFIGEKSKNSIFELLARQTRKYGLTLWIVDQMPAELKQGITKQLANRISHCLTGSDEANVALAGLDIAQWSPIVKKLGKGECIVFGDLINDIPTILKSYFATSIEEEEEIRFNIPSRKIEAADIQHLDLGKVLLKNTERNELAKQVLADLEKKFSKKDTADTIPAPKTNNKPKKGSKSQKAIFPSLQKKEAVPTSEKKSNDMTDVGLKAIPNITKDPTICGGDACIENTRIPVWLIAFMKKQNMSDAQILENYPTINNTQIQSAWTYYTCHKEEIEQRFEEEIQCNIPSNKEETTKNHTKNTDDHIDAVSIQGKQKKSQKIFDDDILDSDGHIFEE